MFKFLNYFKHEDIHKSLRDVKKHILFPLATTVLIFLLVVPLGTVAPVLLFLTLSLIFNYFNLYIHPLICYLVGFLFWYVLKLGGHSQYSVMFASFFVLTTIARSFCLRNYKDAEMVLILLLCSSVSILLLDNSVTLILYCVINSFYILGQILRLHIKTFSLSILLSSMRGALRVALYSLPLMLLFIWLFKQSNTFQRKYHGENITGVSTNMEPGEYAKLSNNYGVAFRVELNRNYPSDLEVPYWRVAILAKGNGLHWKQGVVKKKRLGYTAIADSKCLFKQTVYRQELDIKNLSTTLDYPISSMYKNERSYTALSDICLNRLDENPTENDLLTPVKVNAPLKALLSSLGPQTAKPEVVVDNILSYFKKNKFTVTMEPPTLPFGREFESFLFTSKSGYCEHFSGAMATLLRLKKIPARVVVGYAGGRYNSFGKYWQISYSDSHAWVEYWNGSSWHRIDPTTIVGYQLSKDKKYEDLYERLMAIPLIEKAWFAFDSLSFVMQKTFVNTGKILSLEDLSYDPWLVLASLILLFLGIQIKKRQRPIEEKIRFEFTNLCQLISDKGLSRGRVEGFDAYRSKVVSALDKNEVFFDLRNQMNEIFTRYLYFRYGGSPFGNEQKTQLYYQIKKTSQVFKKTVRQKI